MRSAHAAEMSHLCDFLGQGLLMEVAGGFRIERKIELVFPPEFEAGFRKRIVQRPAAGVALCDIGGVSGDLVCDHSIFDILFVGQPQVLLRSNVAKHRGPEPADQRGSDSAGDVVISRRRIGDERPQRIKGRLMTHGKLPVHVLFDLVHRDMPRSLNHDLAIMRPGF